MCAKCRDDKEKLSKSVHELLIINAVTTVIAYIVLSILLHIVPQFKAEKTLFKAVFEFMGIEYTEEDLYAHVLAMEQIMSTGGGWQDQVGGITPGLKYITSMPGIDQQLKVTHVEIPEEAKKELDDRFVLIYTGQRRLARNLLRDVVGRYVGNEPDSLFALEEIQKTAALMRFELERGNIDGFASLLDYHWELSKKVDAGSSND